MVPRYIAYQERTEHFQLLCFMSRAVRAWLGYSQIELCHKVGFPAFQPNCFAEAELMKMHYI